MIPDALFVLFQTNLLKKCQMMILYDTAGWKTKKNLALAWTG